MATELLRDGCTVTLSGRGMELAETARTAQWGAKDSMALSGMSKTICVVAQ
jgi:hypothetical protein